VSLPIVKSAVLSLAISIFAWGDWRAFFAHPARTGLVIVTVLATSAAAASSVNFSAGRREGRSDRWAIVAMVPVSLALAFLPPWLERRDMWTLGGDGVRYLGLGLVTLGSVLRIWPMFVLGRRFSGLVAIQEGHELATDGIYQLVRNPSYLGMVLLLIGWPLVFRSLLGLVLAILGLPLLVGRIDAEEELLASEFGARYDAYRQRTWRLVPWVY